MLKIFKYDLAIEGEVTLRMPEGARLLTVAEQHGHLGLWAEVDTEARDVPHTVYIRGTGHEVGEVGNYIGTAFIGPFVWHVYDSP